MSLEKLCGDLNGVRGLVPVYPLTGTENDLE